MELSIHTFNIWFITATKLLATIKAGSSTHAAVGNNNPITNRTSWITNNAIPDSIIMNMICRNLFKLPPPVEPKVRSSEVGLIPVALRILNTIMPVIRIFTAMDAAKPVKNNVYDK